MLGNKLNKQHIVKAFHNTRNFLGSAYSHGKNILGSIDNGFKIAKHAYGVISPILDKYAGHHNKSINNHVMNAVKSYDDIKSKVIENHDNLYNDYNHIKNKILKHV
jgi:hypothetical protein